MPPHARVNVIAILELTMRFQLCLLAGIFTLTLLPDTIAQTSTSSRPGLTARELRKQDRQVCTAQSVQQSIAKRNRAEFVRKCMADRQGERRIAARALRKQDRQMCTAQSVQQNVARRNRAEFVRKCMANQQGERSRS
jgi:uncharacterized protein YycO